MNNRTAVRKPARGRFRSDEESQVFLDASGRRWPWIRAVVLDGLATVVLLTAVALPQILASPALAGAPVPDGPPIAAMGQPSVVGHGPLVRVVRLLRQNGKTYTQDPYTGVVVSQLTTDDGAKAARARYAIERYGYSATAHRTISLTFDDGPDPVYTPQLLDLLSARHVPATFFVTGTQMLKYPDIMRRLTREGFALGNHSLTHIDVNATTPFREQLELAVTDRIMRAETGQYSSYFRLPYEGDDEASMIDDVPALLRAQRLGYAVVSHDFDPQDWAYDSGQRTGSIPMPPLGSQDNITVLLHDAGGHDRTRTIRYVADLITAARAQGYAFQTMPQVQPDLQARTGPAQPTAWDVVTRSAAYAMFVLPATLLNMLFVVAVVTMFGLGLLNVVLAMIRARRGGRRRSTATPGVAVLIAAFNEEVVISRTLEFVLASEYPVTEVIVVDDGSTDGTAAMVRDVAARDARVRLVEQQNAGKWAALNRGFDSVQAELVVTLDADTLVTATTVGSLVAAFHSPDVGAVAGVIKVGNGGRNLITRWQALEYLTQIGVERSAAALLNAVMVVPGACAAWRRTAVLEAGGYSGATLAEDCDLTLFLQHAGWRIEQADEAVAYTEAPETVDALLRQRLRWVYGTLQAVWRHRNMLLRPRYGWLGMFVLPTAVMTLVLPLVFTPLVAVALVQMISSQGPLQVLLYFALFAAVYGGSALVAVRLLDERYAHLIMVPVYRLIYEPMRAYLLYASFGTALRGVRLGWNKLARTAHVDVMHGDELSRDTARAKELPVEYAFDGNVAVEPVPEGPPTASVVVESPAVGVGS